MCEIDEKYYDGFEGSPEMIFTLLKRNGEKKEFGIWEGYFWGIIDRIEPTVNGWTGLAYYYHLDIGWFEESPWLVENLVESYEQLKEVDISSLEYNEQKEVIKKIINILKEAIDNEEELYISYE